MCGIETDKAVVDFEMQEEGIIAKILHSAGTKDIPLGAPVAVLVDDAADVKAFEDWQPGNEAGKVQEAPAQTETASASPSTPSACSMQRSGSSGER